MSFGLMVYLCIGMTWGLFICLMVNNRGRRYFANRYYIIIGALWPLTVPYLVLRFLFLGNRKDE